MARVLLNQKMERVWQKVYANHAEFINDIAAYIVRSYNSIRRHSKLGNVSPNAFETVNRYQKNLSSCTKLLDRYSADKLSPNGLGHRSLLDLPGQESVR